VAASTALGQPRGSSTNQSAGLRPAHASTTAGDAGGSVTTLHASSAAIQPRLAVGLAATMPSRGASKRVSETPKKAAGQPQGD
jgi:hypothetical protein